MQQNDSLADGYWQALGDQVAPITRVLTVGGGAMTCAGILTIRVAGTPSPFAFKHLCKVRLQQF